MENEKKTSVIKIEANRENAQKSTGPKDTSVTRLNALKHGILSKEVLIRDEDEREFEEFGEKMRLELAPQGELEKFLVDRIVSSIWRLKRAIRVERDYIQGEYTDCELYNVLPKNGWNRVVIKAFGNSNPWLNLTRYETTIERQIYKAHHELIRCQSARRGEKPPLPIAVDVDISRES